jgi:hypothetical protein
VTAADTEADRIRAITTGLALPGIIDIHTHFMPKAMLDKVWAYFDGVGPLTGRTWPIAYRFDEERRLSILRSFGVLGFTSLNYPHKPDMAEWLNAWSHDFAAAHSDVIASATFYPEPGAGEYVARAIDRGARVFKAHVQVGDYDPNDAQLDQVWGALQESGVPVVIHGGHGPAAGRFTGPDGMETLLSRFPRLVAIIAHMGMPDYGRFLDLADRYPGLHLDTTMAFTDFSEGRAPFPTDERSRLTDLGTKVLFGSDYPNIPYPYVHAVESIMRLDLGDSWARGVLHDNAARLLAV